MPNHCDVLKQFLRKAVSEFPAFAILKPFRNRLPGMKQMPVVGCIQRIIVLYPQLPRLVGFRRMLREKDAQHTLDRIISGFIAKIEFATPKILEQQVYCGEALLAIDDLPFEQLFGAIQNGCHDHWLQGIVLVPINDRPFQVLEEQLHVHLFPLVATLV